MPEGHPINGFEWLDDDHFVLQIDGIDVVNIQLVGHYESDYLGDPAFDSCPTITNQEWVNLVKELVATATGKRAPISAQNPDWIANKTWSDGAPRKAVLKTVAERVTE